MRGIGILIGGVVALGSGLGGAPAYAAAASDPAVIADGILDVLDGTDFSGASYTMNDGQIAYVSEAYYSSADFDIGGFLSPGAIYARAIF